MNIIITGQITEGNKVGSLLGFPTANILVDPIVAIENGVYRVSVVLEGYSYKGIANLGVRPTISSEEPRSLEVHILGFHGNAYGKTMSVRLLEFLRPEQEFASVEELKESIQRDVDALIERG